MSRRVAADKRPKKQNLQTWQPEVPRGKAEIPRRSEEWPGVGRGCPNPDCLHRPAPPSVPKPEKTIETGKAFIKTVQNVFFDSYYPKLQADSENSGSSNDAFSRVATSETLGGSVGSFSRAVGRNTSGSKVTKTSDRTSSRSRLTLDSKTYTLFSCISDVETALGKTDDGDGDGCREEVEDRQDVQEVTGRQEEGAGGPPPISAVGWFSQLCARIETLEDLLQQTLVNSFQLKEAKDPEGQKSEPCKTKILVPKSTMLITDGPSSACVIPIGDEGGRRNENMDTDNEVRNIKERVRALEMKLQQTKMSDFLNSGKPSADFCDSTTPKSSVVLWEVGGGEECTCGKWRYESGNEVQCIRRRRFYTSSTSESPLPGAKGEGKTEDEETYNKTKNKVKRKFISKCRRIREICNSVASSSRKSSRSFKSCKACNEVSYQQAIVTKEFLETFHRPAPFALSTPVNSDQQNNATLLYVKCHQETLAPVKRHRKRPPKKRKDLCRKTGLTNFGMTKVDKSQQWEEIPLRIDTSDCGFRERGMQSREVKEIWTSGAAAFGWTRRPALSPHHVEVRPPRFEHTFRKNATCDCCSKKRKSRKKPNHLRSPIDVLNSGGQIKIPVLFKEVCKPEEPVQKMSNISIRFVMVEEDTKHPLRKLMKKLSQKNSSRKEKYVFGVSQCCCGDEAVFAL